LVIGGICGSVALASSCREPTEITVRVTTGEPCANFSGTAIVVGPNATETERRFDQHFLSATTTAAQCNGGLVGTLVVTPGPDSGTILVAGRVPVNGVPQDPTLCGDPANASSCIIARRSFSFVAHTALTLPIDLDPACLGRDCTPGTTCFKGECVSDGVECVGTSCDLSAVVNAGGLGSGGASDASASDGAYDGEMPIDATMLSDGSSGTDDGSADVDGSSQDGGMIDGGTNGTDSGTTVYPACIMTTLMGPNIYVGSCQVSTDGTQPPALCGAPTDAGPPCCACTCSGGHGVVTCSQSMGTTPCSSLCK
jgi:hypothetical protein